MVIILRVVSTHLKKVKKNLNFCFAMMKNCLLYTSDAADERSSVDLGGRRIIKKKKKRNDRSATNIEVRRTDM